MQYRRTIVETVNLACLFLPWSADFQMSNYFHHSFPDPGHKIIFRINHRKYIFRTTFSSHKTQHFSHQPQKWILAGSIQCHTSAVLDAIALLTHAVEIFNLGCTEQVLRQIYNLPVKIITRARAFWIYANVWTKRMAKHLKSVCGQLGGMSIDDDKIMQIHCMKGQDLFQLFSKSTLRKRKFHISTLHIRANFLRKLRIEQQRRHFMEKLHIFIVWLCYEIPACGDTWYLLIFCQYMFCSQLS